MRESAVLPTPVTRRLAAVLFADVVDSVRLIHADQEGTIARWRTFVARVTHDELPPRQGRIVKLTGDGMLVEFASAAAAVDCALAMLARLDAMNAADPAPRHLRLRIGIHLADVLADDLDLYGDGVNLAARLMALAGPQEIVVSAAVRDQVTDGIGVAVVDLGEQWLKGVEQPVRAFRALPPGAVEAAGPVARRASAGGRPTLAVLPFRDLSQDRSHAFLGDLLAEEVIGALSRQGELFLTARLSTTPFRDRPYDPQQVGGLLGARYVLSGTLLVSGTRLRLMGELTEAERGTVIWAERFDGSIADLFALQERLSREIAERVIPFVRQQELTRARAKRIEALTAYECTLRAIDYLNRSAAADLDEARNLLAAAIAGDPGYALPYALLAHCHVRRVGQGWTADPAQDTALANRFAAQALERDDTDASVLAIAGLVEAYLNKDLEAAIVRYDRALTINPSAAPAWAWSTTAYAWLGRSDEATQRAPRAMELSPFDPSTYAFLSMAGMAHLAAGDFVAAIDCCRRSLRHNRMFVSTHRILTIALMLDGQEAAARESARALLALEPTLTASGFARRFPGAAPAQAQAFARALAAAGVPP